MGAGDSTGVFEYHGWITVRETAEIDDDAVLLHAIVEGLRRRVEEIASPYLFDLRWMNGVPFLHMAGFSNHRGHHGGKVVEFLAEVGEESSGLLRPVVCARRRGR